MPKLLEKIKEFLYPRFFRKYKHHIVYTGLPPSLWYDKDKVMLYANFSILTKFVDDEMSGREELVKYIESLKNPNDPNAPPELYSSALTSHQIILSLYDWWNTERIADISKYDLLTTKLYEKFEPFSFEPNDKGLIEIKSNKIPENLIVVRQEMKELKKKIENDEDEKLIELMGIRKCLWT